MKPTAKNPILFFLAVALILVAFLHRDAIGGFIADNAGLICFGLAWALSTIVAAVTAYGRGHEAACRSFARRAIDESRRQTSIRL